MGLYILCVIRVFQKKYFKCELPLFKLQSLVLDFKNHSLYSSRTVKRSSATGLLVLWHCTILVFSQTVWV